MSMKVTREEFIGVTYDELLAENAKLVDVLHEVEEDAVFVVHCLQSDIEHVMESETEFFKKWWRAECRNDNKLKRIEVLEAENAELRELVRILKNCADECGDCDTCPINDGSGVLNPWLGCDSLRDRMRELGIEVDG